MHDKQAQDMMVKARSQLLISAPFFGTLALHLTLVERPDIPTAATDGRSHFYNPDYVRNLSERQRVGLWVHEILHPASMHHTRRGHRDHDMWNKACDYAINRIAIDGGFVLPDGALVDRQYDGLGAEQIYRLLESQKQGGQSSSAPGQVGQQAGKPGAGQPGQAQPGNGQQAGSAPGQAAPSGGQSFNDPGMCGAILDAAQDETATAQAERDWQAKVRQAISVARAQGAGKIPGELARLVETINKPRLDAREIFRRFIDQSISRDYSWSRPNRRLAGAGYILPSLVPDRPNHVVCMVDSSGSMSDRDVAMLTGEVQAALDEGAADRVTVAYADTRVHFHATYEPGETIQLGETGRGGTAFRQPLEWIQREIPDASAILYMTDMESSDFGAEPECPILWIVTGDDVRVARAYAARAPFGESIILAECS